MSKEHNFRTHAQSEPFYTRALVDAASVVDTAEERSFEVVFATETPVFRRGWDENYNEVLSLDPKHIRKERLEANALPLLDNHSSWSVTNQMGRMDGYTIANGEARAKILFSVQDAFADLWKDIKAGIIRNISVGYRVFTFLRSVDKGEVPEYRAIDWEPLEISLAPVPADYRSKVRSEKTESFEVQIIENEQNTRSTMSKPNAEVAQETTVTPTETARAAATVAAADEPTNVVDETAVRTAAEKAANQRVSGIMEACRKAGLGIEVAEDFIGRNLSLDAARAAIIDKIAERDAATNTRNNGAHVSGVDEVENTRNAISDALLHRAIPGSVNLEGKAHDFKHAKLFDLARHCLQANGENPMRYSPGEVVKRAIATTDYPNILNSTVARSIRKSYDALPAEWKFIATQTTATDFREKTGLKVEGKTTFEEIAEGGEYKESKLILDEAAKMRLKTFGRKISIGRKAIINDDLDIFSRLPKMIATAANNFQAEKIWGLITANAKAPDNKTLFHADHGNLGTAAALGEASLSEARAKMWRQKNLVGEQTPVEAELLIVPVELLTLAQKLMTGITANTTGDVNIFSGKYKVITSPYLTDPKAWYLAGNPSMYEGLYYAYLEGEEGLYMDSEVDFNTDSVVTKARMDFDCAVWGSAAWYKNAGL